MFLEQDQRSLLKSFVWALFVCTDGELGQNPKVTLYTIVPGVTSGSWERHHWRQRLLDTHKAKLLLCMQFPTSNDAAACLDSTVAGFSPSAGMSFRAANVMPCLLGPVDDPSLTHGWSPIRWACRFVQWAVNTRSIMRRDMPIGQHVAERLAQEAWQAALATYPGCIKSYYRHKTLRAPG